MPEPGQDDPRAPLGRGDGTAVVVVDMLNDYDHPDGDALRESARAALGPITRLVRDADEAGVGVIRVNDNHGRWDAGRAELGALAERGLPDEDVSALVPTEDAPFVVKARHSIFYGSPLEYLLETEGIGRLVLVGQVAEQCILYSALDAYIRHFQVIVPRDGLAHIDEELADAALALMERNMRAQITTVDACELFA